MRKQIDKVGVFCTQLPELPPLTTRFDRIMSDLDRAAKQRHGKVSGGALANCHGDWFEWLLSIVAWNVHHRKSKKYILFTVPNVSQFDAATLYDADLFSMINHLRSEVRRTASVELITSNPDFVIVRADVASVVSDLPETIVKINPEVISTLSRQYLAYRGLCGFQDIEGYASVKFSLRPDRRLQISHEGSLVKALYVHLQTRLWITDPAPLKYYAIAGGVSNADRNALRTVATHSITTVGSTPQPAVDNVFLVKTLQDACNVFDDIL